MHGGRGRDASSDQCLGALLTLDQDHPFGSEHPRLVVQRARIGWSHLATLGIPRPELLLATGWVVAVHDGNQVALGIEVIPLGRGGSQLIDRRFLFGLAGVDRCSLANQVCRVVQHPRKVSLHIDAQVGCDQTKNVTAITSGAIGPQSRLLCVEHHLQAVAGAAQHIAHKEFATTLLACGKQCAEHRLQSVDQRRTQLLTGGVGVLVRG